jgi:hypothetical protein
MNGLSRGELTLRFVLVHPQVIIDNNQPLSTTKYHIYIYHNNGWHLIIKYHTSEYMVYPFMYP